MAARSNWLSVDMDGLKQLLARRGKHFALFELCQNAFDEPGVTRVDVSLSRPQNGISKLMVRDDAPEGFHDLTDSFTMFRSSRKKVNPEQRGAFNCGEKFVLALCNEATIRSTTGEINFTETGREFKRNRKTTYGSCFEATLKLTIAERDEMCAAMTRLIPPITTYFNYAQIPARTALRSWTASLPTVKADDEGNLRPTVRQTTVQIFPLLADETATLYEMGIPVVEIESAFHVMVMQKVPLNIDRDNVTPAYLRAVQVEVLNHTHDLLDEEEAASTWVRAAASDPRCEDDAIRKVTDLRFGENRVSYDLNDQGSNREAASQAFKVITGGSMSAGEWDNVRRAGAIVPAGQLFPTNSGTKIPDKVYDRSEWTPMMVAYNAFVLAISPELVDRQVSLNFIKDRKMVCGCFHGTSFTVNLAHHNVESWQENIELMLHELAHTVVKSNDHLNHQFYGTVGKLGAKLTLVLARNPALIATFSLDKR